MEAKRYKMIYIKKNYVSEELLEEETKRELKSDKIRILDHYLVKNNKNKSKLIKNNKKYKLKELINSQEFKDNEIKINILLSKELLLNGSYMFQNCTKLKEFSMYDNIIDINEEYIDFEDKEKNNELKKDHQENTDDNSNDNFYKTLINDNTNNTNSNYSEISKMTKRLDSQDNLNIAIMKTNLKFYQYKYFNMSHMFYNCVSLLSLPDISKINTNDVTDMSKMFYNCSTLLSLLDISNGILVM